MALFFVVKRLMSDISYISTHLIIMNYELTLGVPAIAVGLSAISFSAALQKDAASIPNALEATKKTNLCNPLLSE